MGAFPTYINTKPSTGEGCLINPKPTPRLSWYPEPIPSGSMAFASSSTAAAAHTFASLGIFLLPPSEKLTHNNHVLWKAQIFSALRGVQLTEFIEPGAAPPDRYLPPKASTKKPEDGEKKEPLVKNPEYDIWITKDQTVLSYIVTNLGREI